mgnify:CR=1 FL=1
MLGPNLIPAADIEFVERALIGLAQRTEDRKGQGGMLCPCTGGA